MKKYRCKKSFVVDRRDENGFLIEERQMIIEKGSIYELDENSSILGLEVHLESIENKSWLEIAKEDLEQYFEEVEVWVNYKAEENGKPVVIEDITDFEIDEANETITLLCE